MFAEGGVRVRACERHGVALYVDVGTEDGPLEERVDFRRRVDVPLPRRTALPPQPSPKT